MPAGSTVGSLRSWGPYTVFYGYMTFVLRFAQLEIFCSYKYLKVNYRVLWLHVVKS